MYLFFAFTFQTYEERKEKRFPATRLNPPADEREVSCFYEYVIFAAHEKPSPMKLFERLSYFIVFVGFVLKLFHAPFHTWIILLGLALLFGFYSFTAIAKRKPKAENIAGFAITFSLTALLFTLKFYPFNMIVFVLACAASLAYIIFGLISKSFTKGYFALWIFCFIALGVFRFMPASKKYYMWCVKFNHSIATDYFTWDKYSWFLYTDGKFDEALQASDKALDILKTEQDEEFLNMVKGHHEKIVSKSWDRFN